MIDYKKSPKKETILISQKLPQTIMYQKVEQPSSKTFTACIKIINLIAACGHGLRDHRNRFHVHPQPHQLQVPPHLQPHLPHKRLFGFMMVAAEFKIKFLLRECHFLTHLFGRGIFFLYLASSVYWYFSFGTPDWTLTYVTSMTIFGIGILYLILHCFGKTRMEREYAI